MACELAIADRLPSFSVSKVRPSQSSGGSVSDPLRRTGSPQRALSDTLAHTRFDRELSSDPQSHSCRLHVMLTTAEHHFCCLTLCPSITSDWRTMCFIQDAGIE